VTGGDLVSCISLDCPLGYDTLMPRQRANQKDEAPDHGRSRPVRPVLSSVSAEVAVETSEEMNLGPQVSKRKCSAEPDSSDLQRSLHALPTQAVSYALPHTRFHILLGLAEHS
jgi:hypothetical protein